MEKSQKANQNSAISQKSGLPPQAVQSIKVNSSVKQENSYLTLRDIQKNVAKHKLQKNQDYNSCADIDSNNGGLNSQKSVTNIPSIKSPADVKELLHYYKNQFVVDSSPDQTDRQKDNEIVRETQIYDSTNQKTDYKQIIDFNDVKQEEHQFRRDLSAQTYKLDKSIEDKYRNQQCDTDKTMNKKFSPSILKKSHAFQIEQKDEDIIKISSLLRKSNEKQKQYEKIGQRVKWGLNAQQITDDESSHVGEINSGLLQQNQYGLQEKGAQYNIYQFEQEIEQVKVQNVSQFHQNDVNINPKMQNYFFENKERKQASQDFNSSSDFENLRFQKQNIFEYHIKNDNDFKNTQQQLEEFENNFKFSDQKNLDLQNLKEINEQLQLEKIDEKNQTLTSSYLQTSQENTTNRRRDNENYFHQISKYQDSVSEQDDVEISLSNQKAQTKRSPKKDIKDSQLQTVNNDNQEELIISSTNQSKKSPYSGIQKKYLAQDIQNDSKISSNSSMKINQILNDKPARKSLDLQETNQIQICQNFANSTQPIQFCEKTQKMGQTIQSTIHNIAPDEKINFYQSQKEKQKTQHQQNEQYQTKNQEILQQQYLSSQTSVKLDEFAKDQNKRVSNNYIINEELNNQQQFVQYIQQSEQIQSQPIQVYQKQQYLYQKPYYHDQIQLNVYENQESDYISGNQFASNDEHYTDAIDESKQKVPFLKTLPTANYQNTQNQDIVYKIHHLQQIEVPDQNLMVVCFIKKPEKIKNQLEKRKNSLSLNRKTKTDGGFQNLSQKSDSSRQFTNRSKSQNNLIKNQKSRKVLDKFQSSLQSSHSQEKILSMKDDFNKKSNNCPQFFTTSEESSQLLFKQYQCEVFVDRQNQNSSNIIQDSLISNQLIEATLRNSKDCVRFLAGTYKIANSSLMSAQNSSIQQLANLRLYNFDRCINDYQHQQQVINESKQFMKAWLLFSKICSSNRESLSSTLQDNFKFIFLFGSSLTEKSEELNLMNKNSMLQDFLNDFPESIKYLQISMFFQDQEFILNDRVFDSTKQSAREIGMEIREALRDRSRLVSKLTQQQPQLALFIQKCSHFRIQINDYIFIEMADLRGLQFYENQEVIQTLTNDFGSMTNEILRQSKFYENHQFQINEEQATSALNQFLRNNISKSSKVLLITFVTNDPEDEICSTIALDFSHKIHQYYFGMSGECPIQQIIKDNSNLYNPVAVAEIFTKVQQIFAKLQRIKVRVSSELKKIERNKNFRIQTLMNISFKSVEIVYQKYQQMMIQYKDIINNFYNYELLKVFIENDHQELIIKKIDAQVQKIEKYLDQLKRSIPADRKYSRVSSANDAYLIQQETETYSKKNQKDNIQKKRISNSIPFQSHPKSLDSRKSSQLSGQLYHKFGVTKQLNQNSKYKANQQSSENQYIQLNIEEQIYNKKGLDPESVPITTDSSHKTARKGNQSTQGRQKKKNQVQSSSRLSMPKTQSENKFKTKNKLKAQQKLESSNQLKLRDRFSETGQAQFLQDKNILPKNRELLSKNIDQELQIIQNKKNSLNQSTLNDSHDQAITGEIRKQKINQILNEQSIILSNQNQHQDKKREDQNRSRQQNQMYNQEAQKNLQVKQKIREGKTTLNSIKNPFLEDEIQINEKFLNVKKQETIKSDKLSIDFGNLEVLTNLSQSNLQTKNHNSLTDQQILNQFSQRQEYVSQHRNSLHMKQSSDQSKSVNLLDTTTHRNKLYEISQLQNQIQLLKQQLQFQKQEFKIEMDEQIRQAVEEERVNHQANINQAIKQTRLDVIFKEKENLRLEVKNELHEIQEQQRLEMQGEISGKLRQQLKKQMLQEVKQELEDQLRPQIINQIQDQLREEIRNEIYSSNQFQEQQNVIQSLQNQLKLTQLDFNQVQNMCSENEKIIEKLQRQKDKEHKKIEQNKNIEEKIDQIIHKYEKLKNDKMQLEQNNKQMFIQIETLKNQNLVESQDRDLFLQELINKNKDKSEKINELKENELRYREQIRKSEIVIEDLNEKLLEYEKDIKIKEKAALNNNQNEKYEQLKNNYSQLQAKFEILKDELKNKEVDRSFETQELLQKINEIKEQKENYRKLLIEKKEEVKQLKDLLNSQISRQSNNKNKYLEETDQFIKKQNSEAESGKCDKKRFSKDDMGSRNRTIDNDNKLDDLGKNIREGIKSFRQNSTENREYQENDYKSKQKLTPIELLPPKKPKLLGNQSKNTKSGKSLQIDSSDEDQEEYETDSFINKKNQIFKKEAEQLKQQFLKKNMCKDRSIERNSPPTKDQLKSKNVFLKKVNLSGKETIKDIRSLIEDYKRDNQQLNQVKNNIIKNII